MQINHRIAHLILGSLLSFIAEAHAERALEVADILATQVFAGASLSPRGEIAALSVVNGFDQCPSHIQAKRPAYNEYQWRHEGCGRIELVGAHGYSFSLADPALSFSRPQWSPSGDSLAFLAIGLDGAFDIWVWRLAEDRPRPLTIGGIDPEFNARSDDHVPWSPFTWVGEDKILYAKSHATRFKTPATPIPHPADHLSDAWSRKGDGAEASADVLSMNMRSTALPQNTIEIVDLKKGSVREIAKGAFRAVRISPRDRVAVVTEIISDVRPASDTPFTDLNHYRSPNALSAIAVHTRVGVVDLKEDATVLWLPGVYDMRVSSRSVDDASGEASGYGVPRPVWNQSGDRLAFVGADAPAIAARRKVFILDAKAQDVLAIDPETPYVTSLAWLGDELIFAQPSNTIIGPRSCKTAWCVAEREVRPLFAESGRISTKQVFPVGQYAVFVHDGDIWSIRASTGEMRNETEGKAGTIERIVSTTAADDGFSALVVDGEEPDSHAFVMRTSSSIRVEPITGTSCGDALTEQLCIIEFKEQATSASPVLELVNTVFNPTDLRLRGSVSWSRQGWSASTFVNHTSRYQDARTDPSVPVDPWTTVDLNISYDFSNRTSARVLRNLRATISVLNLFDTGPRFCRRRRRGTDDVRYRR